MEVTNTPMPRTFASVCEAVCYLLDKDMSYRTVLENAGPNKVRLMMRDGGDIMVIRQVAMLFVTIEQDDGYWADKLEDWASDGAEFI
jgi:hypothetical protein